MLRVNQLIGFGAFSGGQWTTAAGPLTGAANVNAWNGYTVRQVIEDAQLSFTGTVTQIRVTFEAGSAENLTISAAYIDNGAAAGDSYDFAGTNGGAAYQLLFDGGSTSTTITAGNQKVSDAISFTRTAGRRLVISFYLNGGTSADTTRSIVTQTGYSALYVLASDASTVNTSGYAATNNVIAVMKVEAFS